MLCDIKNSFELPLPAHSKSTNFSRWYELEVEIALYENKAGNFESWINDIFRIIYGADFKSVKSYGSDGDHKCDGYIFSKNLIIQCYAPSENINQNRLIKKIEADFSGALKQWKNMREWIFICNDFGGIPPKAMHIIENLKKANPDIDIVIWDANDVKKFVLGLDSSILDQLFNGPPTSENFNQIDIQDVSDIAHLIEGFIEDYKYSPQDDIRPIAPSSDKINRNNLSEEAVEFFKLGERKSGLVKDYIEKLPDPDFAEKIATKIRLYYDQLKKDGKNSEQIFAAMHTFFGGKKINLPRYQACIYSYMVYFFERCDFFED